MQQASRCARFSIFVCRKAGPERSGRVFLLQHAEWRLHQLGAPNSYPGDLVNGTYACWRCSPPRYVFDWRFAVPVQKISDTCNAWDTDGMPRLARFPSSFSFGIMPQPQFTRECSFARLIGRPASSRDPSLQALNIAIGQCLIAGAVGIWFFTSNSDKGTKRVA